MNWLRLGVWGLVPETIFQDFVQLTHLFFWVMMASWPPFDKWTRPCISNTPLFCVFRLSPETRERVQTLCIGCKGYIFRTQSFRMLQTLPSKVTIFLWGLNWKIPAKVSFCIAGQDIAKLSVFDTTTIIGLQIIVCYLIGGVLMWDFISFFNFYGIMVLIFCIDLPLKLGNYAARFLARTFVFVWFLVKINLIPSEDTF